jgi:3-oxoadipate CoA-transferase, alpha subunit
MIDKRCACVSEALHDVRDGAVIAVGGFGNSGIPEALLAGLLACGAREFTIISNNVGTMDDGLGRLFTAGLVRKVICSYPRAEGAVAFDARYARGETELELVPQGTLSERLRAGGAGIAAFFTPTGAGTQLGAAKEMRRFADRDCVLETALVPDFALIRADRADRWGNLVYHSAARNFGPVMAASARTTIAEVRAIVELGDIDPEHVVTPGIFVKRVVAV